MTPEQIVRKFFEEVRSGNNPDYAVIIEIASAVYRIDNEKISEYWIQIDRAGIEKQLESNKNKK